MKVSSLRAVLLLVSLIALSSCGCRAIRRFGESRQSIAARRLSGQGFQAMHDGKWDIAETLFSDALDVSKTDDRAHWGLAEAYWNRGEKELAVNQMEQAVRLSAGDPKFVGRLGEMYLNLGRMSDADQQSQIALRATRNSADAWRLRGDCLRAAGNEAEALAAYHRALALQPDFPQVQLQAAEIYGSQQRFDRLLATLDRLQDNVGVEKTPARADVLQGIAMRQLERPEEARRCLVRATKKDPQDPYSHLELATLEMQQGNLHEANLALSMAMTIDPEAAHANGWMDGFRAEQERIARDTQRLGQPIDQLR
ncbi:tetratricopeptide repeat protein [Rubripirellula amarantea]|uniref:Tetratricopeptide repeat protein n=1 Tax=Rubripirellula amarantea TaxID=2527999 RepID=A0A5C5WQT7_9BACT|nr:tetratricopeptide repeat protein [Rubripirellula amarantea]TWT53254.1 tetratricopeptide repeat protein [Rubripirellula amarantea]